MNIQRYTVLVLCMVFGLSIAQQKAHHAITVDSFFKFFAVGIYAQA